MEGQDFQNVCFKGFFLNKIIIYSIKHSLLLFLFKSHETLNSTVEFDCCPSYLSHVVKHISHVVKR